MKSRMWGTEMQGQGVFLINFDVFLNLDVRGELALPSLNRHVVETVL